MTDLVVQAGEGPLWAWRHPRPEGVSGRCIGRTDVPVPARRAKRLARRIQKTARRHGLPRVVHTSPLQRCALVGRYLRRWGWVHVQDTALLELDFGSWDGRCWATIEQSDIDQWCGAFASHAPGGGEALQAMLHRAAKWTANRTATCTANRAPAPADHQSACVLVGHAGWMLARRWAHEHADLAPAQASDWPMAPPYGTLWRLP
jgi:alpha-ribazole phosphatase